MPVIASTFKPPFYFTNGHLQTILRALYRKSDTRNYTRERIETPDDDFLDLDWIRNRNEDLVIICHGLEGSSGASYVTGMADYLSKNGFDILAINFRSCSGEMNRQLRFYHSGETGDLDQAVQYAASTNAYKSISLVGFSIGGNIVLKYLGENGEKLHPAIKRAVAISVPVHLESAAYKMEQFINRIYLNNFLKSLKLKIVMKSIQMNNIISLEHIEKIRSFHEFDNKYTAPLHGFGSATEYYTASSSLKYLKGISVPALLINALNDPFLSPSCFPADIARESSNLYLEMPQSGGHVGFINQYANGVYWTEKRALRFLREL
jgi:uncharacterized protein